MTSVDGLLYWAGTGQRNVKALPIDASAMPPFQTPIIIDDDQHDPIDIEAFGRTIYWINDSDGRVQSFARDGLGVRDISGGYSQLPAALGLSSAGVYWTNDCSPCSLEGFILRTSPAHRLAPAGNGNVEVFVGGEPGLGPLRVSNGYVYWASAKDGGSISRRSE
jgi:hypothetical protein